MAAAFRADPELIGPPRGARRRIAKLHLGAAALTPDVQVDFAHGPRFYYDGHVIPAIVLAAGMSSRMGRPKGTLPLDGGDTFVTRIVRTFAAAGIADVVIVVGRDADAIVNAFSGPICRRPSSRTPPTSKANSRRCSRACESSIGRASWRHWSRSWTSRWWGSRRCVPSSSATLATHAPIVRPVRGGDHGHPVLIDRSLFDPLRHADPRLGAKEVVRAHASSIGDVEVNDDGAFIDIDTPVEYQKLRVIE